MIDITILATKDKLYAPTFITTTFYLAQSSPSRKLLTFSLAAIRYLYGQKKGM
jgi:hypothetical protein